MPPLPNRNYSWHEPKGPNATDILDAVPTRAVFAALNERAEVLAGQLHNEAGVMRVDAPSAQLGELAEVYEHLARFEDVDYVVTRATEAERAGDDHDHIAWMIRRARHMFRVGRAINARGLLEEGLADARSEDADDGTSELLTALALVDLTEHRIADALDRLDEAFSFAREIKSTPAKAHALSAVGVAYALHGEMEMEAIAVLNRAALLHQRTGDRNSLAKVYNNIGAVIGRRGAFTDAIPRLELGLDFAAASPDLLTIINSVSNNIRAHELGYQERAGALRDSLTPLLEELPDTKKLRLSDQTIQPLGEVFTPPEATYRGDGVITELVLFLSLQPTRSLGPHRS